ncbi:MAG: hypothetical protein ACJAT1_002211 [Marivirga sp.]|jgi:hypothetical protein
MYTAGIDWIVPIDKIPPLQIPFSLFTIPLKLNFEQNVCS